MASIGVAIEGRTRFASLLDLDQPSSGALPLTTIGDRQSRALVKLYFVDEGRRELIREFEVRDLQPMAAGMPRIRLRARFDGRRLKVAIFLEQQRHTSTEIDLKPYLPRPPFTWIWVAVPLTVVAFVLLGFFAFRSDGWLSTGGITAARAKPPAAHTPAPPPRRQPPHSTVKAPVKKPPQKLPGANTRSQPVEKPADSRKAPAASTPGSRTPAASAPVRPAFETTTVYFDAESASLPALAQSQLERVVSYLVAWPDTQVTVSGHTALYGNERGRETLSLARAQAVVTYLRQQGWRPARTPVVKGLAGSRPASTARNAQQLNRRAEIRASAR